MKKILSGSPCSLRSVAGQADLVAGKEKKATRTQLYELRSFFDEDRHAKVSIGGHRQMEMAYNAMVPGEDYSPCSLSSTRTNLYEPGGVAQPGVAQQRNMHDAYTVKPLTMQNADFYYKK